MHTRRRGRRGVRARSPWPRGRPAATSAVPTARCQCSPSLVWHLILTNCAVSDSPLVDGRTRTYSEGFEKDLAEHLGGRGEGDRRVRWVRRPRAGIDDQLPERLLAGRL